MISHALTIVTNELKKHLGDTYHLLLPQVELGNIAEGFGANSPAVLRDSINLSVVNIREEKTLKNLPNHTRNDVRLTVVYENPPVFINLQILVVATHNDYTSALLALSRAIRFFQYKNVFTQDDVSPSSMTNSAPLNALDQLQTFKLIFDLYSATMEEVNHLWGTLGGKQYPFVLYTLRMLDLKFHSVGRESGLITEVVSEFGHKTVAAGS